MSKTLPPDPDGQNDDRAKWARHALLSFQGLVGTEDEDAISDLLCDIMHLCDREMDGYETDFEAALDRARGHYTGETMPDIEGQKKLQDLVESCIE